MAGVPNFQASAAPFSGRGYSQRMQRGTKVLLVALLAMLIALNLVLLFLLFRPDRVLTAQPAGQDSNDGGLPTATWSPGTMSSPSVSSGQTRVSPGTSADATPLVRPNEPAPVERLLLATSSMDAWRATVGDCSTPGKIERSTDGGASWQGIVGTGSAPIVRLGAEASGDLFTIGGTGQSCSAQYVTYAKDGAVTATTNRPVDAWFPTPGDSDELHGPGGTKARPCKQEIMWLAPLTGIELLLFVPAVLPLAPTIQARHGGG